MQIVKRTLDEFHMLKDVKTLYVGLSGGADSMALLHLLLKPCEQAGIKLKAIHIHHGIRDASNDEEEAVTRWCNEIGIECCIHKVNVKARMGDGVGLEEAARIERYEIFERYLETPKSKLALGHHQDDQAETVLLNLFRGSGLKGLGGMSYVRDQYIRPLLDVSRSDIEDYCMDAGLPYVSDESNDDLIYRRNTIRHEILPYIERKLGFELRTKLADTAMLIRDDEALFDQLVQEHFGMIVNCQSMGMMELDVNGLIHEMVAMQRRLMRFAVQTLTGSIKGLSLKHINSMIELCYGQTGKTIYLPMGVCVKRSYNRLILSTMSENDGEPKAEINIESKTLVDGQCLNIGEIKFLVKKDFDWDQIPKNIYTKWFDYDRIIGNLVVRQRRNGDYIRIGDNLGKKKVKDVFIDMKTPRDDRDKALIIADDSEVLWIVGYRTNDAYKVTANTKTILQVEYTEVY